MKITGQHGYKYVLPRFDRQMTWVHDRHAITYMDLALWGMSLVFRRHVNSGYKTQALQQTGTPILAQTTKPCTRQARLYWPKKQSPALRQAYGFLPELKVLYETGMLALAQSTNLIRQSFRIHGYVGVRGLYKNVSDCMVML